MNRPFRIFGALGSPYSMKMRSVLRYRRLPYLFVPTEPGGAEIAHVKPPLLPVIQFPDGGWHVDSTPIIDRLEELHPDCRSIVPEDRAQAFLAFLLEDFADEWVTKMMFHYRWFRELDQRTFSRWGVFDRLAGAGRGRIEDLARDFTERQVGRMPLVGCTEENRPLIEATYEELIDVLQAHVTEQRYLFGSRPSRADFALYGQLSQLATDPTPSALMRERAPYAFRWVQLLDDACGVEGEWSDPAAPLPEAVKALLRTCGDVYLPFLLANAAAFERGERRFAFTARGHPYAQGTFKYQVKCLAELRRRFAALAGEAQERVEAALGEAGALEPFSG